MKNMIEEFKIKTILQNDNNKYISLDFLFISSIDDYNMFKKQVEIDKLSYYYDTICVKSMFLLENENNRNNEDLNLIKKSSLIIKNYYSDLQIFIVSLKYLKNIKNKHKLDNNTIFDYMDMYNFKLIESDYSNKYLFKNKGKRNCFNNHLKVNLALSNIFKFLVNYKEYGDSGETYEAYLNLEIENFKELALEELDNFKSISDDLYELMKEVSFEEL